MTYALRFLTEVEEDAIASYEWYEQKVPGLGEEFLRVFYACAGELAHNPFLYPKVLGEFRRRLVRRFSYAIYFGVEGNEIIVFGLFHCARAPYTIRRRLQNRDKPKSSQ